MFVRTVVDDLYHIKPYTRGQLCTSRTLPSFPVSQQTALAMSAPVIPPDRPNENQGQTILGATLTVTVAAFLAIVAGLYVRIRMIRDISWDVRVLRIQSPKCMS
jgi:hypothetical protein